ncbi:lantibiotic dehydratase C-terminal domain-containing protein [Kitasatospora sp. NPDC049258]|uniref:lantibiotic dehydratase C-terminal domain-containing protein n=1 Tax=Kitasatospora sp. NPDC049258 TaxID=3155394 RepID=UPI00342F9410
MSAHVHRHDDHDRILLEAVAPLADSLRAEGLVRGFFYLRYWEGGPHLRVRLLSAPGRADQVRDRLVDALGGYLRERPSTRRIDPDAYRQVARTIAEFEGHHAYDSRIHPADTIRFVPYPPEHASFGVGAALTLVESHFDLSTRVALATLARPGSGRQGAALAMTISLLAALAEGTAGRLVRGVPGGGGPAAFDRAEAEATHRRLRPELEATAIGLGAGGAAGDPGPVAPRASHDPAAAPLALWHDGVRFLRTGLTELMADGRFAPAPGTGAPAASTPTASTPTASTPAGRFPVDRALFRCLHLHLNRLGVTVAQEARLRHIAALTLDGLTQGA